MTWAHVHIALNHVPVMFLPVAVVMLMAGMTRRSADLTNAALVLLVVTAFSTPVVYLTGEPAEEVVGDLPNVSRPAIDEHEESGLVSTVVAVVAGILAAGLLAEHQGWFEMPPWVLKVTLIVAILAAGFMAWTAWLGGHVSHPELRGESIQQRGP